MVDANTWQLEGKTKQLFSIFRLIRKPDNRAKILRTEQNQPAKLLRIIRTSNVSLLNSDKILPVDQLLRFHVPFLS